MVDCRTPDLADFVCVNRVRDGGRVPPQAVAHKGAAWVPVSRRHGGARPVVSVQGGEPMKGLLKTIGVLLVGSGVV